MYGKIKLIVRASDKFVSLFVQLISRKISSIFLKIISVQNVNHSKFKGYNEFPPVNRRKQRITPVGREYTAVDESIPFG